MNQVYQLHNVTMKDNKITVAFVDLSSKELIKSTKTVNNDEVRNLVYSHIHMPAEEFEFGLYREDMTVKQFLNSVVKSLSERVRQDNKSK